MAKNNVIRNNKRKSGSDGNGKPVSSDADMLEELQRQVDKKGKEYEEARGSSRGSAIAREYIDLWVKNKKARGELDPNYLKNLKKNSV